MKQQATFTSMGKAGYFIGLLIVIILLFGVNISPYLNNYQNLPFNPKLWLPVFSAIVVFVVFFSYKEFEVTADKLVIGSIGGISLGFVLVYGKRLSRFFSLPYNIVPSNILFTEISSVKTDSIQMRRRGRLPCAALELKNGKKFRLSFIDYEQRDNFVSLLSSKIKGKADMEL